MESLLDVQRALYKDDPAGPPPLLPHRIEDPGAVLPRRRRRKQQAKATARPPPTKPLVPANPVLPASDLPAGFPAELSYRALAAYATLRTLSIPLRLSPFTPNSFLRALYLPYPNRLLGQVHVHLLRILLSELNYCHYHWREEPTTMVRKKKRKRDGLRWPLRAGDNLRLLDHYTWPVFYDDYCHLTADAHHAALHDDTRDLFLANNVDLLGPADGGTERKKDDEEDRLTVLHLGASVDDAEEDDDDELFRVDDVEDDDDFFEPHERRPKKRRKSNKKKATASSIAAHRPTPPLSYPPTAAARPATYPGGGGGGGRSMPPPPPAQPYRPMQYGFHDSRQSLAAAAANTACQALRAGANPYWPSPMAAPPQYNNNNTPSYHAAAAAAAAASNPHHFPVGAGHNNGMLYHRYNPAAIMNMVGQHNPGTLLYPNGSATMPPATAVASNAPRMVHLPALANTAATAPPTSPVVRRKHPGEVAASAHEKKAPPGESPVVVTTKVDPEAGSSSSSSSSSAVASSISSSASSNHQISGSLLAEQRGVAAAKHPEEPPVDAKWYDVDCPSAAALSSSLLKNQATPALSSAAEQPVDSPVVAAAAKLAASLTRTNHVATGGSVAATKQPVEMPVVEAPPPKQQPPVDRKQPTVVEKQQPVDPNASLLSAFIRGDSKATQAVDLTTTDDEKKEDSVDDNDDDNNDNDRDSKAAAAADEPEELNHWSHFGPLKAMRLGRPYHELSVKDKLVILEYLIDELLSVDVIAVEFSQRRAMTACYHYPYGTLPTKEEMDNLVNEDECAICEKAGELLCCDGCIKSYHRECLSMLEHGDLPEGDWLCPECELKDPAMFGPLRGGRKSALDWFSEADLDEASRPKHGHLPAAETVGQEALATSNGTDNSAQRTVDSTPTSDETRIAFQFLVVQGFVFGRDKSNGSSALHLLSSNGIQKHFQSMGAEICSRWPISQIPLRMSTLFQDPMLPADPFYFFTPGRFDPSRYSNQYRKAPLPASVRKVKEAHLLDYETCCTPVPTANLSSILSGSMTNDNAVAEFLRTSTVLFDHYKMITLYLLKLENQLLRSSLLGEFWKTRATSGEDDAWSSKVQNCRSLQRLAALLLQLLDETHPRAFLHGWFDSVSAKTDSSNNKKAIRGERLVLPPDFSRSDESLRRHWERAPLSSIPKLVAKTSKSLGDWIREVRPDLGSSDVRHGKRKHATGKRGQSQPTEGSMLVSSDRKGENGDAGKADELGSKNREKVSAGDLKESRKPNGDAAIDEPGTTNDISEAMDTSEAPNDPPKPDENDIQEANVQDQSEDTDSLQANESSIASKLRNRRRIDAIAPHSGAAADVLPPSSGSSGMPPLVEAQARQKISELEVEWKTRGIHDYNNLWPIAGRKLFDPPGYLPKPTVRYLARNAGGVAAPFVTYSAALEVGQVSFFQVFRKRLLLCASFEEFLLLLRTLEAFLDHETIRKCTGISQRLKPSKAQLSVEILCSQRDIQRGLDYHLVGKPEQEGSSRWVSSLDVDVKQLVLERWKRRKASEKSMSQTFQARLAELKTHTVNTQSKTHSKAVEATPAGDTTLKTDTSKTMPPAGATDAISAAKKGTNKTVPPAGATDAISAAKKVVDEHIKVLTSLLKMHGVSSITDSKLLTIRAEAEQKFVQSLQPFGISMDGPKIKELLRIAEKEAQELFEKRSAKSSCTSSASAAGTQPIGVEPGTTQQQLSNPSVPSAAVSTSQRQSIFVDPSTKQKQQRVSPSSCFVRNDQMQVENTMRSTPGASQTTHSADVALLRQGATTSYQGQHGPRLVASTPANSTNLVNYTQQVVERHKTAMRELIRVYGSSLSAAELLPARQACKTELAAFMRQLCIDYPDEQISAVIIEAENKVLGEANSANSFQQNHVASQLAIQAPSASDKHRVTVTNSSAGFSGEQLGLPSQQYMLIRQQEQQQQQWQNQQPSVSQQQQQQQQHCNADDPAMLSSLWLQLQGQSSITHQDGLPAIGAGSYQHHLMMGLPSGSGSFQPQQPPPASINVGMHMNGNQLQQPPPSMSGGLLMYGNQQQQQQQPQQPMTGNAYPYLLQQQQNPHNPSLGNNNDHNRQSRDRFPNPYYYH